MLLCYAKKKDPQMIKLSDLRGILQFLKIIFIGSEKTEIIVNECHVVLGPH